MNVMIADQFSEDAINTLKGQGVEIIYNPELKDDTLVAALKEYTPEVLVVRSTKVQAPMLTASNKLKLVVRAGAGVNTIDVPKATELGISVANCPGKNAAAVAELALGLMLSVDRRIPDNTIQLREGKWNKKEFSKARGIKGQTLGLIGVGNIGKEVIERAKAFGMNIVAWSRSLDDAKAQTLGITRVESPLEVAKQADIVSLHVALTDDTRGLCNKQFFDAMKEGACLINTSRSEVIDETALLSAIEKRAIRAGLDLFDNEPGAKTGEFTSKVASHPSVVGTHHIGASTTQAQTAIGEEALRIIQTFAKSGEVLNCVNQ